MAWRTHPICPLVALALAGCGDAAPPAPAPGGVVSVRLVDYRMKPQVVHAERRRLTFRVRNEGRLPHAFRVRGPGGERVTISTLLPGERGEQTVRLRRGEWRMFCPLANHEELGLYGALEVR